MTTTRVRFAPSPTGYLHIGGARTALFNWLWARKTGGKFILRVEDTDQERSTVESERVIVDSMRWLGLDWDEGPEVGGPHGPYFQMKRLELYKEFADRMVREGTAYRCYATREELDALRKKAEAEKKQFVYPHLWRDKTPSDWIEGAPYVVRFKTPLTGTTEFVDRVCGAIKVRNDTMQDFVLQRSDGVPLYNFGAVVDDITMGITLVARGKDHVINTPMQVLVYKALGAALPEFAHLPMMLTPDGKKMSKREAEQRGIDVPVEAYRAKGWLADGVLNYIARFGWSHGDQEIFTRDELVKHFDWEHCGNVDGRYDKKKALWVSAEHLRRRTDAELAELVRPFLADRGLPVASDDPRLVPAVVTVKPRAQTLLEMAEMLDFYFRTEISIDPAAQAKFLIPAAEPHLRAMAEALSSAQEFTEAGVTAAIERWLTAAGIEVKTVAQPARVALTGRSASPGLYEMIAVLGPVASVSRLLHAADLARDNGGSAGA